MQRFGLSDLIGALKEEASSSQILKRACFVLSCRSTFLMVLYFHIHLALSKCIASSRIFFTSITLPSCLCKTKGLSSN